MGAEGHGKDYPVFLANEQSVLHPPCGDPRSYSVAEPTHEASSVRVGTISQSDKHIFSSHCRQKIFFGVVMMKLLRNRHFGMRHEGIRDNEVIFVDWNAGIRKWVSGA